MTDVSIAALRERLGAVFEIADHPLRFIGGQSESSDGIVVETVRFETGSGEAVRGVLTRPDGAGPHPAILYIHAHGGRYEIGASELLEGRPALQGPLGEVLARMGYVTLAIDLPCFGQRAGIGESAAAKALLWRGRSLAGQMLGELSSALDWLAARPDVDPARIGAYGISMGATFGYWLAAVDERIACLVHQCCYADFGALIEAGNHDLHGIYLTVPGLLGIAANGVIAGLVAPRPQLACIGDLDPLTPPLAVEIALAETRAAYACAGAADMFELCREPEFGHQESPAMREATLAFLTKHLG
jgi:dienelactone hydrolase